jgi:hypothetical protein
MDKKTFNELLESVREAKAIMRGEKKPARVTRLEPESPRAIRKAFCLRGKTLRLKVAIPRA